MSEVMGENQCSHLRFKSYSLSWPFRGVLSYLFHVIFRARRITAARHHKQAYETRRPTHLSALHSSCHMSACEVPTNHYCLSLPADDQARSWSWSATVMLSCHFHPRSVVWKWCLIIYFLMRVKWCTVTLCRPGWCVVEAKVRHLLALPPLCCRAISFWVGGAIGCVWICLCTDPETSGSVVVSAPQLFWVIAREKASRSGWNRGHDEVTSSLFENVKKTT